MDKKDISLVIHLGLPSSIEAYLQEAGRSGRDGRQAHSVVLVEPHKPMPPLWKPILEQESCRRVALMRYMGEEQDNCGGCDYCAPLDWTPHTETFYGRMAFLLKREHKRMGLRQFCDWVLGWHTPAIRRYRLHLDRYFGAFADYTYDEVHGALEFFMERGWLRVYKRGLWKGMMGWRGGMPDG